jgi:hypothetical protein
VFLAFVNSETQFFGGRYVRYSSYLSQATFQFQNLFSESLPVVLNACSHSSVPGVSFSNVCSKGENVLCAV